MDIHDEINDIRRRAGLHEQARAPLPMVSFSEVYHVGGMDPKKKGKDSYEGAGLSFSFHPKAWSKIARIGTETWVLTKTDGTFLDYLKMTPEQRDELAQWGIQAGYVSPVETYIVSWYDDEWDEEMHMELDSREEAEAEAEDREVDVKVKYNGLTPTPTMVKRIGWKSPPLTVPDHLATLYAEDNGLDGVWWNETLNVKKYSAPRGVIVPSMVSTWQAEPVDNNRQG